MKEIPYRPLRKHLSRAELAGILGFYFDAPRFPPRLAVNAIEPRHGEDSALTRVLRGQDDVLEIEIDDEGAFETFRCEAPPPGEDGAGTPPAAPPPLAATAATGSETAEG